MVVLPKGMPRTRRRVLPGEEDVEPRPWRIRPGQFGTSGQSRRAFVLDTLAARASAGDTVFEGLDFLSEAQRREILERIRAFQDESQFAKQDEHAVHRARAISETAKMSNSNLVKKAMEPLFAKGVKDKSTFESVVLGLLQATDPDLARVTGKELAASFAESCVASGYVGECMDRLRKQLCQWSPEFLDRLSNLGFPMNPCGDFASRK